MSLLARELNNLLNTTYAHPVNDVVQYAIRSDENEYVLEVAVPGMSREEVVVDVEEGVMSVTTKSVNQSRLVRNFARRFVVTKDADPTALSAKLENGILTVRAPRIKPLKKVVNVEVV